MHLILRGADCAEMKFLRREGGAENREIMRSRMGGRERASVLSETTAQIACERQTFLLAHRH